MSLDAWVKAEMERAERAARNHQPSPLFSELKIGSFRHEETVSRNADEGVFYSELNIRWDISQIGVVNGV